MSEQKRQKLMREPSPANLTRAEPWPHCRDQQAEKANWQAMIDETKNG